MNARASDGRTALSLAGTFGDPDAVRLLLEHGADPNLADRDGVTPLIHSLRPRRDEEISIEILRLRIGAGTDVNAREGRGAGRP